METEPSTAFSTCLQFRILSIRRYCFLTTKSWCVFDPIPERGFVVRIVPSPMVPAEFTSPVRSLQLPVARNLPGTGFSSGRVWRRRDAPPCYCGPKPPAQTVPGTVCLTSAVIIHFELQDQSNKKGRSLSKSGLNINSESNYFFAGLNVPLSPLQTFLASSLRFCPTCPGRRCNLCPGSCTHFPSSLLRCRLC